MPLLKKFKGLGFGDRGYLGKKIFEELIAGGLKLITRTRKNMKTKPHLSRYERQLLNQRGIIETVIGHLKHCYQVWHTRHRSIMNALTHLVAALAAYTIAGIFCLASHKEDADTGSGCKLNNSGFSQSSFNKIL